MPSVDLDGPPYPILAEATAAEMSFAYVKDGVAISVAKANTMKPTNPDLKRLMVNPLSFSQLEVFDTRLRRENERNSPAASDKPALGSGVLAGGSSDVIVRMASCPLEG